MPNRIELQDKGKGCGRNPNTGLSDGKGASDKGIRIDIRRHKRDEAERRNFLTPEHLRRSYWKAQGYSRMSAYNPIRITNEPLLVGQSIHERPHVDKNK